MSLRAGPVGYIGEKYLARVYSFDLEGTEMESGRLCRKVHTARLEDGTVLGEYKVYIRT